MPSYYFDSSAFIKNYHSEEGSEEVWRIVNEADSIRFISRLTAVETQRIFALIARTTNMTAEELRTLRGTFYRDLTQRRFHVERLRDFHYHSAVRLVLKYWQNRRLPLLRSLDAIHLAAALAVRDRSGLDYFVCADDNLCTIARQEQLSVINPLPSKDS
jgi:predicted nucleic acid-binding protein